MTTNEYVPSEDLVIEAWKRYSGAQDAKYARLSDGDAGDEARRFLARVRRDAARGALDGLAIDLAVTSGYTEAEEVRDYRDAHYPEETP